MCTIIFTYTSLLPNSENSSLLRQRKAALLSTIYRGILPLTFRERLFVCIFRRRTFHKVSVRIETELS